jgi:cytochrome c553
LIGKTHTKGYCAMFKPERVLLCVVLAGLLAACGTPATQAPTFVATQALPTRVPVIEATQRGGAAGVTGPTAVSVPPTVPPTVLPTKPPATATRIPASPTSLPATATMNMPGMATQAAQAVSGDATKGEALFKNGTGDPAVPACSTCHNVDTADVKVGPSLQGVATHGGMHAHDKGEDITTYLRTSILNPNDYLVPNVEGHIFSVNGVSLMFQDYAKHLTPEQVNDLVAYLLTLK